MWTPRALRASLGAYPGSLTFVSCQPDTLPSWHHARRNSRPPYRAFARTCPRVSTEQRSTGNSMRAWCGSSATTLSLTARLVERRRYPRDAWLAPAGGHLVAHSARSGLRQRVDFRSWPLRPPAMSAFVLLLSDEPTSGATKTKRLIYEYAPWFTIRTTGCYCPRIMIRGSAASGTLRHCALSSASNCQVSPLADSSSIRP